MDQPDWDDDEFLSSPDVDESFYDQDADRRYVRAEDIEDFRSFRSRIAFAREVVADANDVWGESGILSLIHAIESETGWALEIIAERSELDNILLDRHGVYDDDAWLKLKSSDAWIALSTDIYELTTKRMHIVASQIVNTVDKTQPRKKSLWNRLTGR